MLLFPSSGSALRATRSCSSGPWRRTGGQADVVLSLDVLFDFVADKTSFDYPSTLRRCSVICRGLLFRYG